MRAWAVMAAVLVASACGGEARRSPGTSAEPAGQAALPVRTAEHASWPQPRALPWNDAHDLDGDGRHDHINVTFTGGAHCCYRIAVELSATASRIELPFELDGGFPAGLDLSQPDRFAVQTGQSGVTELVMEIATYNGERQPLPPAWREQYGVTSHRIAVRFSGRIQVRNLPE